MEYAIRFTSPAGVVSWYPKGFGHTCHEHATDVSAAERFDSEAKANRSLYGYISPPAFWNSERQHAEKMRQQFRNWKCEIVPLGA
jgi:hypothetical protein